ncbi:MAG: A/G-specific adenine glycosylase [Bryobacteraceae bacterium]
MARRTPFSTQSALARFRARIERWYESAKRDLPWRRTRDPYRIWVSEIMLQQTRVAAAVPYFERFLERFPDAPALAAAAEAEVLAAWAGLGYYSRARNLHRAAQAIAAAGFPRDYDAIRALPGVGGYTAAAIASIAFGLPHAVLDGNVIRVLARLLAEREAVGSAAAKGRLRALADRLLDRKRPGDYNQALMELGATVCLPRSPRCSACPVAAMCEARRRGLADRLPVKAPRATAVVIARELLLVRRCGRCLLWQRPPDSGSMAGFWELPETDQLPQAARREILGHVRHTIMDRRYVAAVIRAEVMRVPRGFVWVPESGLDALPLSTLARKALRAAAAR